MVELTKYILNVDRPVEAVRREGHGVGDGDLIAGGDRQEVGGRGRVRPDGWARTCRGWGRPSGLGPTRGREKDKNKNSDIKSRERDKSNTNSEITKG